MYKNDVCICTSSVVVLGAMEVRFGLIDGTRKNFSVKGKLTFPKRKTLWAVTEKKWATEKSDSCDGRLGLSLYFTFWLWFTQLSSNQLVSQ
jgi:hypothetical protein